MNVVRAIHRPDDIRKEWCKYANWMWHNGNMSPSNWIINLFTMMQLAMWGEDFWFCGLCMRVWECYLNICFMFHFRFVVWSLSFIQRTSLSPSSIECRCTRCEANKKLQFYRTQVNSRSCACLHVSVCVYLCVCMFACDRNDIPIQYTCNGRKRDRQQAIANISVILVCCKRKRLKCKHKHAYTRYNHTTTHASE